MISFETFNMIMTDYLTKREEVNEWLTNVDKAFKGAAEEIVNNSYEPLLLSLLTTELNDDDEWLYYFIYEKDCEWFVVYLCSGEGTTEEVEEVITINSLRKLYDLITKGISFVENEE